MDEWTSGNGSETVQRQRSSQIAETSESLLHDSQGRVHPNEVREKHIHFQTEQEIPNISGYSTYDRTLALEVKCDQARDADMKLFSAFKNLTKLDLSETGITDSAGKTLAGLSGLTELNLARTAVTDSMLSDLLAMNGLQDLVLSGTPVTDSGMGIMNNMKLQHLTLEDTRVTDKGLEHLKGNTSLRSIDIQGEGITQDALKTLLTMPNLEHIKLNNVEVLKNGSLNLKNANVGDEVIADVAHLTSVHALNMSGTRLSDAGMKQLASIPLEELLIYNTSVSDDGMNSLRQSNLLQSLRTVALNDGISGTADMVLVGAPYLRLVDTGSNNDLAAQRLSYGLNEAPGAPPRKASVRYHSAFSTTEVKPLRREVSLGNIPDLELP